MKRNFMILCALLPLLALAQPTLEWQSQILPEDLWSVGWLTLRENPLEARFWYVDYSANQIKIMDGLYSNTVAITIPLEADEEVLLLNYDASGDGLYDLLILKYISGPETRYAFRIVNPINGETIFQLDDPNYSYYVYRPWYYSVQWSPDMDNDGYNELYVQRSNYNSATEDLIMLVYQTTGVSSVSSPGKASTAMNFSLDQNFPNPFNPDTKIKYTLSHPGQVSIDIFDPSGRMVRKLTQLQQVAGNHETVWDGKLDNGNSAASGVYFYRLEVEGMQQARRMIFLK